MAYAKRLTAEQYAEMKTRYQMGDSIYQIAKDFNYDNGNLTRRFNKDGLVQGELQLAVKRKIIDAADSIKEITPELQTITDLEQRPFVENILNKRANHLLELANDFADIAMKLNRNLLAQVHNMSKPNVPNGYKPHESTQILKSLVSTQDILLNQTGVSAKTINSGNSTHSELSNIDNALDASRAYQEMINGSK